MKGKSYRDNSANVDLKLVVVVAIVGTDQLTLEESASVSISMEEGREAYVELKETLGSSENSED